MTHVVSIVMPLLYMALNIPLYIYGYEPVMIYKSNEINEEKVYHQLP